MDGRAAASTRGHSRRAIEPVARSERVAAPYSLADDLRPHVRGPEDEHRPEQRQGYRARARARLVGDANDDAARNVP